jgi:hypothetical protein
MIRDLTKCCLAVVTLGVLVAACGCGGADTSARPDIAAIPDEEHFGKDIKGQLYVFRAKVRKRGAEAAKQDLPDLLEGVATYEQRRITKDKDVYKEIVEKLKALQTKLAGSASKEEVVKAADEVGALADKLPGKADANPSVE